MNLSKQTSDAIQILLHCHGSDNELAKVGDIASDLGLPKQMALKLANILSRAGLVETMRGPSGGIRLTEAARTASLGLIVRMLETQPRLRMEGGQQVDLGSYIDEAFAAFLDVLDRHTLAEMATDSGTSKRVRPVKKRAPRKRSPKVSRQSIARRESRLSSS